MTIFVEMGNAHPQDLINNPDGSQTRKDLPGPAVTYVLIPDYPRGRLQGLERVDGQSDAEFEAADEAHRLANETPSPYVFPETPTDDLLNDELAEGLAAIPDGPTKANARRMFIKAHLGARADGVTHLPNHSAFLVIAHPTQGSWASVATPGTSPTWVWSSHPGLQAFLAEFYGCPEGRPDGVEDTHYTQYGKTVYPPGAAPAPDAVALHTNIGRDQQSTQQFGWGYIGQSGVATATSSTSLTAAAGASHSSNDSVGQFLFVGPNTSGTGTTVYGLVTANTSGTTPVFTVDRWYVAATPGGSAATTPNGTGSYLLASGGPPTIFVGLSTSTVAPTTSSTTMTGEYTTAGGGLIRQIAPITHSAGAATVVATPVYTANSNDSGNLPITIALAGASQSLLSTYANSYQTQVSPTATLSSVGDQLTLTWTWTLT